MSIQKTIEEKLYTPAQLEKLNELRAQRELEKEVKQHGVELLAERKENKHVLKEGDRVGSHLLTSQIDHKGKGIVLKVTNKHKGGIHCDVRFGRYIFVGVPSLYVHFVPKDDIGKVDSKYWLSNFPEYLKIQEEYKKMPTRQLLMLYQETLRRGNRLSDAHKTEMKRELETRGHVPRKADRSHRGKIERIEWKDFYKEFSKKQ